MRRMSYAVMCASVVLTAALLSAQTPAQTSMPAPVAALASASQRALPERLTDAEFWSLRDELSEPPGEFRSENLVSNETMYQWPIPELVKT
ncbi:MAG: hypothetical protein KAY59_10725, partial [Acidobacteria bacterium]|nr:hypothetical protein [Acidobacteriota bacterium]